MGIPRLSFKKRYSGSDSSWCKWSGVATTTASIPGCCNTSSNAFVSNTSRGFKWSFARCRCTSHISQSALVSTLPVCIIATATSRPSLPDPTRAIPNRSLAPGILLHEAACKEEVEVKTSPAASKLVLRMFFDPCRLVVFF